jgi:hypothetical protein
MKTIMKSLREAISETLVAEFSGVGAVAGFTGPLGAPDKIMNPFKNLGKNKKKSKK